jgi:two-component system, chemotaxis family, chemotaxis protein CheY
MDENLPKVAGTILVIDDEPALRSVLCTMLEVFGFSVVEAGSATLALTLLEEITPDLVLTDVMMPDMDGLTLIRKLRAEPAWAEIPALVISAKTTTDDRMAAELAGASGFLAKPFSAADLKVALRQLTLPVPD